MDLVGIYSKNTEAKNGFLHFFPASSNEVSASEQLFRIFLERDIAMNENFAEFFKFFFSS